MRKTRTAASLEEIIAILEEGEHQELVWVGKNYSKANLIRDLKRVNINASETRKILI